MKRIPLLIAAAAGAAIAVIKRRRGEAEAKIWRDATSDNSR